MVISSRLRAIAQYVQIHDVVADIGSDHGLLALYLLEQNPSQSIYATEWKQGPYVRLRNALQFTSIKVYQANGLQHLPPDVTTVVISGMGGITIQRMLHQLSSIPFRGTLILSPQSDIHLVRIALSQRGFAITEEAMIFDEKYYWIIIAQPGTQILTELESRYGPILLKQKPLLFKKWIAESIHSWEVRLKRPNLSWMAKRKIEGVLKELHTLC